MLKRKEIDLKVIPCVPVKLSYLGLTLDTVTAGSLIGFEVLTLTPATIVHAESSQQSHQTSSPFKLLHKE